MTNLATSKDQFPSVEASGDRLPQVAIIIVHWIGIEDTVECLVSLASVDYPCLVVILVNNGSTDFDEARVRQAFPGVLIVASSENLGFAGGNNLGIARALGEGADLIFLLNNDTVVCPDLIWSLLPALSEPDVGIAGPVIQHYYAPDKIWFAGGHYSRLIGYSYRRRPLDAFDHNRVVDWVNGCAMLVRREVFETVGMLWDPFFLNCEDVDFCLAARKANYRCVLVGKPLVRHKVSASGGIRGTDHLSPDKAYYFARNSFHLLRRHTSGLWALTGTLSQFAVVLPYWTLQCILARNINVLRHYLAGMWDGILGRTGKRPA